MRARILRAIAHLKAARKHLSAAHQCLDWRDPESAKLVTLAAVPSVDGSIKVLGEFYVAAVIAAIKPTKETPKA